MCFNVWNSLSCRLAKNVNTESLRWYYYRMGRTVKAEHNHAEKSDDNLYFQ